MFVYEGNHWWYKSLHTLIAKQVNCHKAKKSSRILDLGCGTGGLLEHLRNQKFSNMVGIDIDASAIRFALSRDLNVKIGDITEIGDNFEKDSFDIITCIDCLPYLTEFQTKKFMDDCSDLLTEEGFLILNLPAMKIFSGEHDIAVGLRRRYSSALFRSIVSASDFSIIYRRFWPFFLSPGILVFRLWSRLSLLFRKEQRFSSDLHYFQQDIINKILFWITKLELSLDHVPKFGSSYFVVLKKDKAR